MSEQDNISLLKKFDSLPDLLSISIAKVKNKKNMDRYKVQNKLRKEYTKKGVPFKYSMPYRHMRICSTGEHNIGAIKHELINPKNEGQQFYKAEIWSYEIHNIREHKGVFTKKQREFLDAL